MKFLIARHADAGSYSTDPEKERGRELTDAGIDAAERMAADIERQGMIPKIILASNFVRTQQTADIVGKALGVTVDLIDELAPHMPFRAVLQALLADDNSKRVMLVAHTDNIGPAMASLDGDMGDCAQAGDEDLMDNGGDWPSMDKGEYRYLKIDRTSGDWQCQHRFRP